MTIGGEDGPLDRLNAEILRLEVIENRISKVDVRTDQVSHDGPAARAGSKEKRFSHQAEGYRSCRNS